MLSCRVRVLAKVRLSRSMLLADGSGCRDQIIRRLGLNHDVVIGQSLWPMLMLVLPYFLASLGWARILLVFKPAVTSFWEVITIERQGGRGDGSLRPM